MQHTIIPKENFNYLRNKIGLNAWLTMKILRKLNKANKLYYKKLKFKLGCYSQHPPLHPFPQLPSPRGRRSAGPLLLPFPRLAQRLNPVRSAPTPALASSAPRPSTPRNRSAQRHARPRLTSRASLAGSSSPRNRTPGSPPRCLPAFLITRTPRSRRPPL